MPALHYHKGQTAVQDEAHTTGIAQKLAHWVGPIEDFASLADLFLFALPDAKGILRFTLLSGAPPLVEFYDENGGLRIRFPPGKSPSVSAPTMAGGLSMRLDQARRVRLNGRLIPGPDGAVLETKETFTLCRKYMAPSVALDAVPHLGPSGREPIPLSDKWLLDLVARSETSFLASKSPDGAPDVAHRGGPPGFLKLANDGRKLTWVEYVGDGVFKSAGNVRSTGDFTLLVPDLETGDGVELVGRATYTNHRSDRRVDPLIQHSEAFPVQGIMDCDITAAFRLRGVWHPRKRIAKAVKITSQHAAHDQAPQ
jgi:uncharacterized protein